MITTIDLYVALCSSPTDCDAFLSHEEGLLKISEQCAKEERTYRSFKEYTESDCYVINTTY